MSAELIENKRINATPGFEMRPTSLDEAMKFATIMADSDIVPKEFKGKPGNVLVAIQMGHEIGLQPMQSLQSIAIINGKPTVYGDAAIALAMRHPECDDIIEKIEQDPNGNHRAYCTVKRKGDEPRTYEFSVEDAKKAGLWGKAGAWTLYPKRMLQMRARGFALRDKFPDALKGLSIREEVLDYEIKESEQSITKTQEKYDSKSDMLADMLTVNNNLVIEAEFEEPTENI